MRLKNHQNIVFILAQVFLYCCGNALYPQSQQESHSATKNYDIIIYGATPSGVLASIAAASEGSHVLLLDPRNHFGGMMTGGLSTSDIGSTAAVIGGRTLEFFQSIGKEYGRPSGVPEWNFEPHIALKVFQEMASAVSQNLTLTMNTRLVRVQKSKANKIERLYDTNGNSYSAKIFLDCSYEGFLLPLVNVSHTWGRESAEEYNESVAGVIPEPFNGTILPNHQFTSQPQLPKGIDPYLSQNSTTLIPLVQLTPPGELWSADDRTQAYNFRITLTNDSSNLVPFPKPSSDDPSQFELFRRAIQAGNWTSVKDVLWGSALPNPTKFDCNVQLMDWIGENYEYPNAVSNGSFEIQNKIWERHLELTLGYLWFMSHDDSVPVSIREGMSQWGLPADEFLENENTLSISFPEHFPPQLYVREALRMVGPFVFTQSDRELNFAKNDSIGMGSYSIDVSDEFLSPITMSNDGVIKVLHVSRYADESYGVLMEGGIQAPAFLPSTLPPFEIPYRVMLPDRNECTNLLVPVAVSASHIGFCTIRLEPTWMIMGESAGIAAHLAATGNLAVQDVPIVELQSRLQELNQIIHL